MLHEYDRNYSLFELSETKDVFSIGKIPSIKDKIFSIRFKYARNIKGFPYLPYAKEHTKLEIKQKLLKAILRLDENKEGKFYNFPQNDSDQAYNKKFLEIENKFFDKEENFFSTLNLSNENAGVFLSADENVAYLINFNDHLQIVIQDQSCNFKECYHIIKKIHHHLSTEINFDYNAEYGYLTSCPSNLGMGLRISAILSIPKTAEQG
jgi:protein arginine kinase